jgi:hypothetical protein
MCKVGSLSVPRRAANGVAKGIGHAIRLETESVHGDLMLVRRIDRQVAREQVVGVCATLRLGWFVSDSKTCTRVGLTIARRTAVSPIPDAML